jgi:hypothetical protein
MASSDLRRSSQSDPATAAGNRGPSQLGAEFEVPANMQSESTLTSLALASSPPISNVNDPVTLTATLTGADGIPPQPTTSVATSTVTFSSNGDELSDCTGVSVVVTDAANGISTATCTTHLLTAGSNSLTAAYAGDGYYSASSSGAVTQAVMALSATLSLLSSAGGSVPAGASVSFTAQVAATALTPVYPTGTIAFLINGTASTDCPAMTLSTASAGAATCTTSALEAPADIITATYTDDSPNPDFIVSPTSATVAQAVTEGTATVVLSPLPAASVNQPATFTATVMSAPGAAPPTGNVTFTASGFTTPLCSAAGINPVNQQATCTYAFASANGGITITAAYSGDQNFSAKTTRLSSLAITPASTTTSVTSLPAASKVNQPVVFTAVVTPAFTGTTDPTGTVVFSNTSTSPATTLCVAPVSNGVAPVCDYIFVSAGTYNVVAIYTTGDPNFTSSKSDQYAQGVSAQDTSVVLTSLPNLSDVNEDVTFSATIVTLRGQTLPQGTMLYEDTLTGTTLCETALTAKGIAPACAFAFPSAGEHTILATFTSSDSNFKSGVSNLTQVVKQTATTTTVVSLSNSPTVNGPAFFTAAVTPAFASPLAQPTGTVAFSYGPPGSQTVMCPAKPIIAGAAPVCTYRFPSNGTYQVVATYTGDSNFAGSISTAEAQSVGAGSTSIDLRSFPNPSLVNQTVTFHATISFPNGKAVPTGVVTYFDGANPLCTVGPEAKQAGFTGGNVPDCNVPLFDANTHQISASYVSSNSNFMSSSSLAENQFVNKAPAQVVVAGPLDASVNQPIIFTATISPRTIPPAGSKGAKSPTGKITFTYAGNGSQAAALCLSLPVNVSQGATTAACKASLPAQGAYTITASYNGDTNFDSAAGALLVHVGTTTTSLSLSSSPRISVVSQAVTFTAKITPSFIGEATPEGTVTFKSKDDTHGTVNTACPIPIPVAAGPGETGLATCTAHFPSTETFTHTGQVEVTASYNPIPNRNFAASEGSFTQVVQNYSVAFTSPASDKAVLLTQGYSNATDPFGKSKIVATVTSSGGFHGALEFTCSVVNSATSQPVSDPSCIPSSTRSSGSNGTALPYTVSASSKAAIGSYALSLTASDKSFAISQSTTMPVIIDVVGMAAPVSLGEGATSTEEDVVFDTAALPNRAAPRTLNSFACGAVVTSAGKPVPRGEIACIGPTTTGSSSGGVPVAGSQTTVPIILNISPNAAGVERSKSTAAAGSGGSLANGSYLVQVVATDQSGLKYYAVIPLIVN